MATSKGKNNGDQQDDSGVEIEQTRRLKVRGMVFEQVTATNGDASINFSVEKPIEESELVIDDIDKIVSFLASFQRRTRRSEQGQGGGATDGRGQVLDPGSDSRLKGNEENRPSDPDRSRQAGRAK